MARLVRKVFRTLRTAVGALGISAFFIGLILSTVGGTKQELLLAAYMIYPALLAIVFGFLPRMTANAS